MKSVVQNIVTEYKDEGTGPVLLLLHGWQDTLHSFDEITPLLLKQYRVIRLDLPGFGNTETPKDTWNLDNYIQFVDEFIKKLEVDVAVLVGHSFGGRIAIKGIATHTFRVQKLILIASAGIAKRRTFKHVIYLCVAKVGGLIMYIPPFTFLRTTVRKTLYTKIGSDYLNAGVLKNIFLKIISEDLSVYAHTISIPVLLIWGAKDTQTPIADGQRFKEMIPESTIKIINTANHFVHKENPHEVVNFIQSFI